jgi:DNA-binding protein H-NS
MNSTIEKSISKLTVEELMELKNKADELITQQKVGKKSELEQQFREQAAQVGLTIKAVVWSDGRRRRGKGLRKKYAAKYRNPSNPDQVWSGQGRTPAWMQDLVNQGRSREEFLITA